MLKTIFPIVEYLVIIAVTIYLLVFFHNYYLFFLLVFLIVLPFLSIGTEFYVMKHLQCNITAQQNIVQEGQESAFSVSIQNPTWIPLLGCYPEVQIHNHFFPEYVETIKLHVPAVSRQTKTVSFSFTSKMNGDLYCRLSSLTVFDMLHLVCHRKTLKSSCSVSVIPSPWDKPIPSETNLRENGFLDVQNSYGKTNSDNMIDIRKYRPGDRLQHIHWKLSAKKESLLVKEFEVNAEEVICLLIDLIRKESLSSCLSLLYSFCEVHLRANHHVILAWWSCKNEIMKYLCLQSENDIIPALLNLYSEESYESASLALDSFDSESIGFHSFYYINKMIDQSEGGCSNVS